MTTTPQDPLSRVVTLLKPTPSISKRVEAGGQWRVERHDLSSPFYCAIVEGVCFLEVAGHDPVKLVAGDFVLIPDLHSFAMYGEATPLPLAADLPLETGPGVFRLGLTNAPVEVRALVGYCRFAAPGKDLLLSLLPEMIHVRGEDRLMALVPVIHDETRSDRLARTMILERLLEVMLIEALRSHSGAALPPGLLRGLSHPQLAEALRHIHADATGKLSIADLARCAGMSRSGFFEHFRNEVGKAPMDYASTWRMSVAKDLLLGGSLTNSEVALRVGYGSASAFGLAFMRHEGMSPGAFVKQQRGSGHQSPTEQS
ncbi:AraC family transcriptional regulator [uncultured Cohaesibacter sp.]|uniref:AraC family transcriptional regulator n=1 Tax=uncultured Cohaesibacter sp. TaxID=1002546 RepID=UPI0029C87324|nr:AraC family transcriptional regulator [uncultured Cohaesibacter sp.]